MLRAETSYGMTGGDCGEHGKKCEVWRTIAEQKKESRVFARRGFTVYHMFPESPLFHYSSCITERVAASCHPAIGIYWVFPGQTVVSGAR